MPGPILIAPVEFRHAIVHATHGNSEAPKQPEIGMV